jgi:hypothetical protein
MTQSSSITQPQNPAQNPAHLDLLVLQDRLDRVEKQVPRDLLERLDRVEKQVLLDRQALSALLDRLESVITSAKQFWLHKTTLLTWMIVILVLIVLDRLLLHFPQIVGIVTKLL